MEDLVLERGPHFTDISDMKKVNFMRDLPAVRVTMVSNPFIVEDSRVPPMRTSSWQ
jgi:hypothetical protein